INIEPLEGYNNTHIVHFDGDFDGSAKENLTEIQGFMDSCESSTSLIFDFSKLNYLNSYAIGHLVAWHNHLSKNAGRIYIAGTNKNVEDIFAILGISNLFKIFADVEAAKAAL
ncbi:STAS domain-containing protein, partial [bacterium]|nr:STAS domain-containing protein [bacterium]